MEIGVNYTPRSGWFHSWLDLDPSAVEQDFRAIAGAGLDHVRIFPLWSLLQPNRTLVRESAVADVARVVDLAADHGLTVHVDAINGHLSSYEFLPSWVVTWHRRDLFADPLVAAGQRDLLRRLAEALSARPNARGIGLGNEIAQFASPGHPTASRPTSTQVTDWLAGHFAVLQEVWADGEHTHSYDDSLWFQDDHPFVPDHAIDHGATTTVHSWVFTGAGQRYGANHPALTSYARYLLEVAAGWAPSAGRPLWLQEVGAPISHVAAEDAAGFAHDTLLACASMPGLERITWWCSHDVSRSQADFPELEYSLGLFDADGRRKPIGDAVAELVPVLRDAHPGPRSDTVLEFDVDPGTGTGRSAAGPRGEVFDTWQQAFRDGEVLQVRPHRTAPVPAQVVSGGAPAIH